MPTCPCISKGPSRSPLVTVTCYLATNMLIMTTLVELGTGMLLADRVLDGVRQAVRTGTLVPGRIYSAYELAEQLGISRSPVREGLLRLSEAGLVRMHRQRGFEVVRPDLETVIEIFHLRLLLEVPAVRLAAGRADRSVITALRLCLEEMNTAARARDENAFMMQDKRFHGLLLAAAGNRSLLAIVDRLRDLTRSIGASTVEDSRTLRDIHAEHLPVFDAVVAHDSNAAAAALTHHLSVTLRLLIAQTSSGDVEYPRPAEILLDVEHLANPPG